MIASTGGKMLLVLLGITLLASASIGGWTWWSQPDAVESGTQPIAQIAPTVQHVTTAPVVENPVSKDEPRPKLPPMTMADPITADVVVKKELPNGVKHLKQDDLLLAMALQLHAEARHRFLSQPGAGMRRMQPAIETLPREWKIPQWTSEEITKEQPPQNGVKDLSLIHRLSLNQFSESNSQGPKPKPSEKVQRTEQTWEIHSLDLVGLVMHEMPKVYVSKRLPEMKELKNTPIRDMDVFESEGLEELVNGKDLYVRSKEGTMRVLGPIRASKTCLKCHGDTNEGDMLGAFSYTLRVGQYRENFNRRFQGQIPQVIVPRDVP